MEIKIDKQCKGTRIITSDETKERRIVLNKLISIADKNGFDEIILPSIEPSQIYVDKAGNEILNQMYNFKDKGDRDICLRPEVTATIQLIGNKYYKTQKDVKLWYFEKCYRYERPQKGRYREFYQFGMEILNPKNENTKEYLIDIAKEMVETVTNDYIVTDNVKRGLDYYVEDGFEISINSLKSQRQILGGGKYSNGIGYAIGFDRLMLCK